MTEVEKLQFLVVLGNPSHLWWRKPWLPHIYIVIENLYILNVLLRNFEATTTKFCMHVDEHRVQHW